jgi:hypothetical protein
MALVWAVSLVFMAAAEGCPADPPAKPAQQNCVEGDACWDCKTMGNKRCGPADPKRLVLS